MDEAAAACAISPRRARAIITAMADAGLLAQAAPATRGEGGQFAAAEWRLSEAGRSLSAPPVLIVDGEAGLIIGIRLPADGSGNAELRRLVAASGLSTRAAAQALRLNSRTLRRMLSGALPIAAADPVIGRAAKLRPEAPARQ